MSLSFFWNSSKSNVQIRQKTSVCPAIDKLIQSTKTLDNGEPTSQSYRLKWIAYTDFMELKQIQDHAFQTSAYEGTYRLPGNVVILLLVGKAKKCTPEFIQEFARIYSLPVHKHDNPPNIEWFRRYPEWLRERNKNKLVLGFTRDDSDNYYLVISKDFSYYYSLYGFCSACGILRCSPVWCICGHKELSNGWTSKDKKLDEFIKKSQRQTKSPNDAYLEWVLSDQLTVGLSSARNKRGNYVASSRKAPSKMSSSFRSTPNMRRPEFEVPENLSARINEGMPTWQDAMMIRLDGISEQTNDLYYDKLCNKFPDLLDSNTWITIGFTFYPRWGKYALIKSSYEHGLCLACGDWLDNIISEFCYTCKAPRPPDWTTGNKSLDSFITRSWRMVERKVDGYVQWIDFDRLENIHEAPLLNHGCTHEATLQPRKKTIDEEQIDDRIGVGVLNRGRTNVVLVNDSLQVMENVPSLDHGRTDMTTLNDESQSIKVILKMIADGGNAQSFDFYQFTKDYPNMLTSENIWLMGVAQDPSTRAYYLVFYQDIQPLLHRIMRIINLDKDRGVVLQFMQYDDFDKIKEIGSGGYGTVYTADCKSLNERVALKCFKNFDQMAELFISEFKNHSLCSSKNTFLKIYGITQEPEAKDYMIVMQYANDGNLLSYLNNNINKLTWKMKLGHLMNIAYRLYVMHEKGLVHCDLHGGNIVLNNEPTPNSSSSMTFICDLGLSKSVNSPTSDSSIQGVLPYIAPELFHTRQFTQESDIYSFGILAYLIASGEPPYRDRPFDEALAKQIIGGLRPALPDSTPEAYRKLAEMCCDADPNKRPSANKLYHHISDLLSEASKDKPENAVWDAIHYKADIKPLSRVEKNTKYSSRLLPTIFFTKTRSCSNIYSVGDSRQLNTVIQEEYMDGDSKQAILALPDDIDC